MSGEDAAIPLAHLRIRTAFLHLAIPIQHRIHRPRKGNMEICRMECIGMSKSRKSEEADVASFFEPMTVNSIASSSSRRYSSSKLRTKLKIAFSMKQRSPAKLSHPGIVPVYEIGKEEDTGSFFYAMKWLHGETLAMAMHSYMKMSQGVAKSQRQRELLNRFHQVCLTLAYAHHQKVIHRDLKPANVILGEFGETVVLDWGLAKKLETHTSSIDACIPQANEPFHWKLQRLHRTQFHSRLPSRVSCILCKGQCRGQPPTCHPNKLGARTRHCPSLRTYFPLDAFSTRFCANVLHFAQQPSKKRWNVCAEPKYCLQGRFDAESIVHWRPFA